MAESVTGRGLRETRGAHGIPERALKDGLVDVTPAAFARRTVNVDTRRRENPLPGPFFGSVRVLAVESVREGDVARPTGAVLDVMDATPLEMAL